MILVGGAIVLAGTLIAAEILGYPIPFAGPLLLVCGALIIVGVYVVNKGAIEEASGGALMNEEAFRICCVQAESLPDAPEINLPRAKEYALEARKQGASLIVFPEQYPTGWDPQGTTFTDDGGGVSSARAGLPLQRRRAFMCWVPIAKKRIACRRMSPQSSHRTADALQSMPRCTSSHRGRGCILPAGRYTWDIQARERPVWYCHLL